VYEQFYGLREKPFNMTPDPEFLFFTEKHKEAFAHLVYGIRERRGFIEITGEVGAGKTTLCRALLNEFDTDTKIALILNPFLTDIELLRAINEELYIDSSGETTKELLDTLNKYLIDQHAAGRNVVLLIDESQNLPIQTLEQIRIISNLETVKAKLIQIVLVGQPELRQLLSKPELRQLNQRITVRYHISPLSRRETDDYIYHRLKVAGDQGGITFSKEAIDLIFKITSGVPRMINILCDHALLSGFVFERFDIDEELIKKARREIEGKEFGKGGAWQARLKRQSLVFGGIAAAILIAGAFYAGLSWSPRVSVGQPKQVSSIPGVQAPSVIQPSLIPSGDNVHLSELKQEPAPVSPTPVQEAAVPREQPKVEPPAPVASAVKESAVEVANAAVAESTPEPSVSEPEQVAVSDATLEPPVPFSVPPAVVQARPTAPAVAIQPGEPGKFDARGVLRCDLAGSTRAAALATLAYRWVPDATALESLYARSEQESPEAWEKSAFESFGLTPVSWSSNLSMVRAINLPAVIEVYEKALFTPGYLTLLAFVGDRVAVADPRAGRREIGEQDLSEMWFGRLTILVPASVKPKTILGRNANGAEVRMLQVRLKKLGYFEGEPNGFYGESTEARSGAFNSRIGSRSTGWWAWKRTWCFSPGWPGRTRPGW
jgi:general secretion pathway protein A